MPAQEATFAQELARLVDAHLEYDTFNVSSLAQAVGLSRVQLYRRVCRAVGETPASYIRRRRLERAARLLREEGLTVTETVYEVGLNNLSYFAKVFQQQYGVRPSVYATRA